MDVNAEIATRATAVLVLMQDWLATGPPLAHNATDWERLQLRPGASKAHAHNSHAVPPQLLERASELLATRASAPPITDLPLWPNFLVLARRLVQHLAGLPVPADAPAGSRAELHRLVTSSRLMPAAAWRRALRRLLYAHPIQRLKLCTVLSHEPITDFFEPLLIQEMLREPGPRRVVLETTKIDPVASRQQVVDLLLSKPKLLADCLDAAEVAVPFVHVLGRELEEIARRRTYLTERAGQLDNSYDHAHLRDDLKALSQPFAPGLGPFGLAESSGLMGLALSGGGIRSATFALGAVQALAQRGWLPRLDYLSTVSGGGYLGSWLAVLIQRLGSVHTAQQHLDPSQATNPRAEENRPVRWLRSFSNYLAPRASLFSTDTWTLFTTWLRNALLNQVVLVLFMLAGLLVPHLLLARWQWWGFHHQSYALGAALLLLACTAGLAGWQQRWYDRAVGEAPPALPGWLGWLPVPGILPALLLAAGWHLSAFAAYNRHTADAWWLWFGWTAGVLCGWLLVVAALGRYHLSFRWKKPQPWVSWLVILLISALAAATATVLLLVLARMLPPLIVNAAREDRFVASAVMVLGPALAAEVLGLALTVRMALLGQAFSDERREWWGRLGAQTHLAALGWVLLTSASLLLPRLVTLVWHLGPTNFWPVSAAAWVALVGAGVKLAQSTAAPAEADAGARLARAGVVDVLTRVAPYLFLAGLLVLLVWVLQGVLPVSGAWGHHQGWPTVEVSVEILHRKAPSTSVVRYYPGWQLLLALTAGLGLLSWLLAW